MAEGTWWQWPGKGQEVKAGVSRVLGDPAVEAKAQPGPGVTDSKVQGSWSQRPACRLLQEDAGAAGGVPLPGHAGWAGRQLLFLVFPVGTCR